MRRAAGALLAHVNLLLAVVGGAALSMAARLKWDPSAYVPLRELCPREYAAAAALLAGGGAALLLAAHVAAAALALSPGARARRPLLVAYAAWQTAVWAGGWAWAGWCARQAALWLRSEEAARVRQVVRDLELHVRPLLALLARFHPLPEHVADLIQEAEADAPRYLYAAVAALLLAALLLPLAALLALLAAHRPPPPPQPPLACSVGADSTASEKSPLRARAAYRGGRLVLL